MPSAEELRKRRIERCRAYYAKNREKLLAQKRQKYKENPEIKKEIEKRYVARNKDKVKIRRKRYYENNKLRIRESKKKHYLTNREGILKQKKEYSQRTNYASDKTPAQYARKKIKARTKYHFPLDGQTCEKCNGVATERHHNTIPIQWDKFEYLCHGCHVEEHSQIALKKMEMQHA